MRAAALAVLLAVRAAAAPPADVVFSVDPRDKADAAALVERARAETARAMSPADLSGYLGLPFDRPVKIALPPRRADGGFGLDTFEGCAALEGAKAALGRLEPRSDAVRDHLAVAAMIRVVARDLGEPAAREVLERRVFAGLRYLPAVVVALRERETAKTKVPLAALDALRPLRLADAEAALAAGDLKAARASADAAGHPAEENARRRLAAVYVSIGSPEKARALLPAPAPAAAVQPPKLAGPALVALAADEAEAGRKANAFAALKEARAAGLDPASTRRELEIRARLGDAAADKELLEARAAESPSDPAPSLALAELAARAGDAAAARARLAEAAARKPSRDDRRRAALVLQTLKDYPKACAQLRALAAEAEDASLLGDLGVCEWLGGSPERAAEALEKAVRLDPKSESARSSLDAVRASLKNAPSGAR